MSTQVDELTDLMANLDDQPACEGAFHKQGTYGHVHDAPAEYLARWRCPECGSQTNILQCAGRVQAIHQELENTVKMRCNHSGPISEFFVEAIPL